VSQIWGFLLLNATWRDVYSVSRRVRQSHSVAMVEPRLWNTVALAAQVAISYK